MELTKFEDAQEDQSQIENDHVVELVEAQLAIVGGGVGEVGLN